MPHSFSGPSTASLRPQPGSFPRPPRARLLLVWLLGLCTLSWPGCKSTLDNLDVSNIMGPAGRRAKQAAEDAQGGRQLAELEGHAEFEEAKAEFDAHQFAEARKKLHKIVKRYKDKPIEEDAMFYRAEADYRLEKYAKAQDEYEELLKKHPSTRYLETSTQRLYDIALGWLGYPKNAAEVELAHFARMGSEHGIDSNPDTQIPAEVWFPINVANRRKPIFDPEGRALECLRSVWMNDPTGPLADDALLMHAVHRLRSGDYIEADRDFATIREQYADREVAMAAYVLGAHASLLAYQGAHYDGKQLEEARQLTESALRLFPEAPQKKKLENDLARIDSELANRDWEIGEYHRRRGEKSAAAFYYESLVKTSPESQRALAAKEKLVQLGPDHAAGLLPKPIYETEVVTVSAEEETPEAPAKAAIRQKTAPRPQ